jgi:hypothetical protein
MNAGRWYPTVTTLPDGQLLVVAGSYFDAAGAETDNDLPQVFDPVAGTWRDLTGARYADAYYPFMYVAPNGLVFDAGPRPLTRYLDTSGSGAWTTVDTTNYGTRRPGSSRNYGSSAMYTPGRVVILGGSRSQLDVPPESSVEVIDLQQPSPAWRDVAPMAFARRQHTGTLLPDGTLFVAGGSSVRGFSNAMGSVLHPELWDPAREQWRTLAPHREARLYHSITLLLPDGRVLLAGGGHPRDEANREPDHFEMEIYSPPYLFRGRRPTIRSAPATVAYGEVFPIGAHAPLAITSVSLVRLGSVTHGFDENQRFVPLAFRKRRGFLEATAPAGPTLAPPGDYLLFILRDGVPSIARVVRLGGGESWR